jgi:hypothetical protein
LQWYQMTCFVLLQQKWMQSVIQKLNVSHKLASGYIAVFARFD